MNTLLEEKLCYPVLALIVLAIFYGIYFGKMLAQKRHGIRTHQIGRRKEKELHTVERLMYIGVLLMHGNLLTFGFSAFAMVMLHLQILHSHCN